MCLPLNIENVYWNAAPTTCTWLLLLFVCWLILILSLSRYTCVRRVLICLCVCTLWVTMISSLILKAKQINNINKTSSVVFHILLHIRVYFVFVLFFFLPFSLFFVVRVNLAFISTLYLIHEYIERTSLQSADTFQTTWKIILRAWTLSRWTVILKVDIFLSRFWHNFTFFLFRVSSHLSTKSPCPFFFISILTSLWRPLYVQAHNIVNRIKTTDLR